MKKLFITALIAVAIGTSAFADPNTSAVNSKVLNNFSNEFRGSENVSWKISSNFIKASFVYDEKAYEAFYNVDGDLIGTSSEFNFAKLPKKAIASIAKQYPYPPYKLNECIEYTNADGEKNYFVSFEKSSQLVVLQVSLTGEVSEFKQK